MTSTTETAGTATHERAGSAGNPSRSAGVVRLHGVVSVLYLVVGLVLTGVAAATLIDPHLTSDLAGLTYGRLQPMALSTLVFGWLVIALIAVAYHVVPRAVGAPLAFPLLAMGNGLLMAAGVAVGVGGIGMGRAEGGRLMAMPMEADGLLLVSFLVSAVIVTATARRGDRSAVPLSAWYLVAAPWWLFASYAVGSIPGMSGLPGEVQTAFASTAVVGLFVAAAGVGGGYHLISRLVPDGEFNPDLGRIGFWSLGFTWVWTTGMAFQYGPTGDWFETLPVVFGAGLVLAVVTILADFAGALRSKWSLVRSDAAFVLYAGGTVLFAVVPVMMLVQSFRSVSSVVRFTQFEGALEMVAISGAFTLWALALIMHAAGVEGGRRLGGAVGWLIAVPILVGGLVAAAARAVAGLHQGLSWLSVVQEGDRDNFGETFRVSVEGLDGLHATVVGGVALVLTGAILGAFFLVWLVVSGRGAAEDGVDVAPLATNRLQAITRGALILFVVGALGAFVFPAQDSRAESTLLADRSRLHEEGSLADRGRQVYVSEGCMYCHTQQVRAIVTDVGLGPVSVAGDYAHDPVGTAGYARIGPDLAHAGSRDLTDSARWVRDHLLDPRAARPWSVMPSYAHLTDDELTALSVYVAGLE